MLKSRPSSLSWKPMAVSSVREQYCKVFTYCVEKEKTKGEKGEGGKHAQSHPQASSGDDAPGVSAIAPLGVIPELIPVY